MREREWVVGHAGAPGGKSLLQQISDCHGYAIIDDRRRWENAYRGGGRDGGGLGMRPRSKTRRRCAAWYSMARLFRPSGVPRESHFRSRSRTLRTGRRQVGQQ